MSDYNGWTNYATWRVNLEIFDGIDPYEYDWHKVTKFDLADLLKDYAVELIDQTGKGIALEYAIAFLADVNWQEIAKHMIEAYTDEEECA